MCERFPLPIGAALEWFRSDGPRTEERLLALIDHMSLTLALPVTEAQRREAVEYCAEWLSGFVPRESEDVKS